VWITGKSAERLGVHDHSGIVWDEIAAFLALALVLPDGWPWLAAGFVVFRGFDIFKPWPIRDLDHRLSGGLGIMLDDLAAAVFSAVVLRLLEYLATQI
jgi:phosphatidylglycerophosphatase A